MGRIPQVMNRVARAVAIMIPIKNMRRTDVGIVSPSLLPAMGYSNWYWWMNLRFSLHILLLFGVIFIFFGFLFCLWGCLRFHSLLRVGIQK